MGHAKKRKQVRRYRADGHQQAVKAARTRWHGKLVAFDAGRGDGMQQGRVTEVSDDGLLYVECLPEYRGRVVAVALSLDMVDQLTLVDAGE